MILNIRHLDVAEWMSRSVLHWNAQRGVEFWLTKKVNHATSFFCLFVCLFLLNSHHSEARYVTKQSMDLTGSESICHNQNSHMRQFCAPRMRGFYESSSKPRIWSAKRVFATWGCMCCLWSGPFGSWVCTQLVLAYEGFGLGGCGSGFLSMLPLILQERNLGLNIWQQHVRSSERRGALVSNCVPGLWFRPVCYYTFYQSKTWIQWKIPPFSERKVIASVDI